MDDREYWAAKGRKSLGPFETREGAEAAGRAQWGEKRLFTVGWGRGGAYFDLRGVGRIPLILPTRGR